jgi:hypothetical protein
LQVRSLEVGSFKGGRVRQSVREELLQVPSRQAAQHCRHNTQGFTAIGAPTATKEVADTEFTRGIEEPSQQDRGGQLLASVVGRECSDNIVERVSDGG